MRRVLHAIVVPLLLFQAGYAAYQLFVVLRPENATGWLLFGQATEVPFELMVARRLYAIEAWIAVVGLALYLAISELLPRALRES